MKNFVRSQAVVFILTVTCFGEGTILETKEDVYERKQCQMLEQKMQVIKQKPMKFTAR